MVRRRTRTGWLDETVILPGGDAIQTTAFSRLAAGTYRVTVQRRLDLQVNDN